MLKIQSVNHVSEHLSAIYPVYTFRGGPRSGGVTALPLNQIVGRVPFTETGSVHSYPLFRGGPRSGEVTALPLNQVVRHVDVSVFDVGETCPSLPSFIFSSVSGPHKTRRPWWGFPPL